MAIYAKMAEKASANNKQRVGGIGQFLGSWLAPEGEDPVAAANEYFNQIPGTVDEYYGPYVDAGRDALGTIRSQYQTLLNDPGAIINLAGSGFQESPGYQYQLKSAINAADNAAAAGGMLGTPSHQETAAAIAQNLANQDYWKYTDTALGRYDKGLAGEEGINRMGYEASDSAAQGLIANLMNQGGLAYAGTNNANQAEADRWNNMVSGATSFASSFF